MFIQQIGCTGQINATCVFVFVISLFLIMQYGKNKCYQELLRTIAERFNILLRVFVLQVRLTEMVLICVCVCLLCSLTDGVCCFKVEKFIKGW